MGTYVDPEKHSQMIIQNVVEPEYFSFLFISPGGGGEEGGVRAEPDRGGDGGRGGGLWRGDAGGQRRPLHREGVLCRHLLTHQPQRGGGTGRHFQGKWSGESM